MTDNSVLDMFGLGGLFEPDDSVKSKKIQNGISTYNGSIEVDIDYENYIVYSEVKATATTNLFMLSFFKDILGRDQLEATSSRVVTDTLELIRTFNFSKYIWKESGLGSVYDGIKESINNFFGGG
ncbi:hypothetical protein GCM10008934_17030 [Virgibacillus salarius]|uniref:hypothetical protein n=1 Tax=Virgibacillus salarius TaxID=447199 RepID=UPI0031D60838